MAEETTAKARSRNTKMRKPAGRGNEAETVTDNLNHVAPASLPDRHARIAFQAYLLYEGHGRPNGRDLEHWLEAEQQILRQERGHEDRPVSIPT